MTDMSLLVQAVAATLLLLGSALVLWVVRATDQAAPKRHPAVAVAKPRSNYQPDRKAA